LLHGITGVNKKDVLTCEKQILLFYVLAGKINENVIRFMTLEEKSGEIQRREISCSGLGSDRQRMMLCFTSVCDPLIFSIFFSARAKPSFSHSNHPFHLAPACPYAYHHLLSGEIEKSANVITTM